MQCTGTMALRLLCTKNSSRLFSSSAASAARTVRAGRSAYAERAPSGETRRPLSSEGLSDAAAEVLRQKERIAAAKREVALMDAARKKHYQDLEAGIGRKKFKDYFKHGKWATMNVIFAIGILSLALRQALDRYEHREMEEHSYLVIQQHNALLNKLQNEEWAEGAAERLGIKDGTEGLIRELKELIRVNAQTDDERRLEAVQRDHNSQVEQRVTAGKAGKHSVML